MPAPAQRQRPVVATAIPKFQDPLVESPSIHIFPPEPVAQQYQNEPSTDSLELLLQDHRPSANTGSLTPGMLLGEDVNSAASASTFDETATHYSADQDPMQGITADEMLASMHAVNNPNWWSTVMMPGYSWQADGVPYLLGNPSFSFGMPQQEQHQVNGQDVTPTHAQAQAQFPPNMIPAGYPQHQ